MKKLLAALLVVVMILPMASIGVFSAPATDAIQLYSYSATTAGSDLDDLRGEVVRLNAYTSVFLIPANPDLMDSDHFTYKIKKSADTAKIVSAINVVEKTFSTTPGAPRVKAFEVKLIEDMTTTEYKVDLTFTFKKKASSASTAPSDETRIIFYVQNDSNATADKTSVAGAKGLTHKPVANGENTVEWIDADGDVLAKVEFDGASDVTSYYPKLSTKWDNKVYADKFADQDAYMFSFVGNPTLSATSRPTLSIYNPYFIDDELTVPQEDIVVYQLVDGEFKDVTAQFTIELNEDDDYVLVTKTRTLGTYVIAQAPLAEAEAPDAPEGEKPVPNTGR
jgi:hypothetical protein